MSDVLLVLGVAAITFASRASFMIRPRQAPGGQVGRFLDVFPVALFVAIAVNALVAPIGSPELAANLIAAAGGIVGGFFFRRSVWGVFALGAAFYYLARSLLG
jgi:branched-subunit amino acid transport protein